MYFNLSFGGQINLLLLLISHKYLIMHRWLKKANPTYKESEPGLCLPSLKDVIDAHVADGDDM